MVTISQNVSESGNALLELIDLHNISNEYKWQHLFVILIGKVRDYKLEPVASFLQTTQTNRPLMTEKNKSFNCTNKQNKTKQNTTVTKQNNTNNQKLKTKTKSIYFSSVDIGQVLEVNGEIRVYQVNLPSPIQHTFTYTHIHIQEYTDTHKHT